MLSQIYASCAVQPHSSMSNAPSAAPPRFSFMSANFLGREKNYQNVTGFGDGSRSVQAFFSPVETYAERVDALFAEVAAMGFHGIDLWTAHCHPNWMTPRHVEGLLAALERHKLTLVSIAGGLNADLSQIEAVCRMARTVGCPLLGMGCRALPEQTAAVESLLARHDVCLGFENHPDEPTPEVVLEKIGRGRHPHIGVTFDTGWWGTHAFPVLEALDVLRDHLFLVHLKNVQSPGAHEAAPWEGGCLDLQPVVRRLKQTGYPGWISLEYEPLDHDPTGECRAFLETAERWWNHA